ncbi:MAG TPA: hypothetical protein VHP33_18425 [Polyangiaceae bacterium]|nr:hypothetical protein [Polyangiaceae bacterium]
MGRRGGFYGAAFAFLCGGCSAPPAAVPAAPAVAPPSPTSSQVVAAPVVASAAPEPPPKVWTTPERSNVCTEYARAPAAMPTYETREACEEWVKQRSCQPGYTCYDGCNWNTCTGRGEGMISTLLGCTFGVAYDFEFQTGTTKLSSEPDWSMWVPGLQRALRVPERKMTLLGYAEAKEAQGNAEAQKRLALRRAQLIVRELEKRGIAPNRMLANVGDPAAFPRRNDAFAWRRVRIELEPAYRVRGDFEPGSSEYEEFCGVKSRRGE